MPEICTRDNLTHVTAGTDDTRETSSSGDCATGTDDTGETSSSSDCAAGTDDTGETPSSSDCATGTDDTGETSKRRGNLFLFCIRRRSWISPTAFHVA